MLMRQLTMRWNASATSCGGERPERCFRSAGSRVMNRATTPIRYCPVACDRPCYVWCEVLDADRYEQIARVATGQRRRSTTHAIDSSCGRIIRTNSVGRPQDQALFTLTTCNTLCVNVFRPSSCFRPRSGFGVYRRLQRRSLEAAPQIVRVELWRALPLPPAQQLIDPDRTEPMADILIETEHAVWTLMVRRDDWLEGTEAGSDPVADSSMRSGSRALATTTLVSSCSILTPPLPALVRVTADRKNSLSLRSGSRSGPKVNVRGVGLMCWADLAAILRDCEESRVLSDIERALAANALPGSQEVGIVPTAERSI